MPSVTEIEILDRIIDPRNPNMTRAAAEAILRLGYSEADHLRMAELAEKSNEGALSEPEKREFESYVFVGDLLSLLQSKARLSLRQQTPAA